MTRRNSLLFLFAFPAVLTTVSFFVDTPTALAAGLFRIITSPSLLLTDYLAVGGAERKTHFSI